MRRGCWVCRCPKKQAKGGIQPVKVNNDIKGWLCEDHTLLELTRAGLMVWLVFP